MKNTVRKNTLIFIVLSLMISGCHSVDPIPVGVSTFVSKEDFKRYLGYYFTPQSFAIDKNGSIYAADTYHIVVISPYGQVIPFAGNHTKSGFKNGHVPDVLFHGIQGLAFDQNGNLYVAEQQNHCIRKITPDGTVSLFAGKPDWNLLPGYDNPADGPDSAAHFAAPTALAVDLTNNLFETESGFINRYSADGLRKITPNGYVKTIAGEAGEINAGVFIDQPAYLQQPSGLAVGKGDTIFVADSYNALIRAVLSNGQIITVAGTGRRDTFDGPAKSARFMIPTALTYHPAKGLCIADVHQIRLLSANGQVTSPTGSTENGYRDGSLAEARFNYIADIHFDANGILYVADGGNSCIRRVNLRAN